MKPSLDLAERKIAIVTGKGGVGKSTISLALAVREAKRGKKVLLVELGTAQFFSELSRKTVDFTPRQVFSCWPGLHLARWTGRECLQEYVSGILKLGPLVTAFFSHPVMKALIDAAPALSDVATLGKLTSNCRDVASNLDFDLIILDGFSTGHFLSMLKAPLGLAESIRFGPMGTQSREIHDVLTNLDFCSYVVVALPEEYAVQEAIEMHDELKSEFGISPHLIVNQMLPQVELKTTTTAFSQYLRSRYDFQNARVQELNLLGSNNLVVNQVFESDLTTRIESIVRQLS